jgi:hypothetical protein
VSEKNRTMLSFYRVLIATFIFANSLSNLAFADQKFTLGGSVSLPATQTPKTDNAQSNDKSQILDCTRPNRDPRCKPVQPPYYFPHDNYSRPHRPRAVIINQLPAEPAIDINSLTDNWEDCRKAKLGSMHTREIGNADQANRLDEWLWKNCRSYSNELRQLEQNDM